MYYFMDMYDGSINLIDVKNEEKCAEVLDSYNKIRYALDYYFLGDCVFEAYDKLERWNAGTKFDSAYLMRHLHQAERLARGFLFEFRTCLDHIETDIKHRFGKNSAAWNAFKNAANSAYDNHHAYGFTYHLRNCAQHCTNVVHGFCADNGRGISCSKSKLLADYDRWNAYDKDFFSTCGETIDLMKIFSEAFSCFNEVMQATMEHILNVEQAGAELSYLREWGDCLTAFTGRDIHAVYIADIRFKDGTSASKEDMDPDKVDVNAHTIDWDMIYRLSGSIEERTLPEAEEQP